MTQKRVVHPRRYPRTEEPQLHHRHPQKMRKARPSHRASHCQHSSRPLRTAQAFPPGSSHLSHAQARRGSCHPCQPRCCCHERAPKRRRSWIRSGIALGASSSRRGRASLAKLRRRRVLTPCLWARCNTEVARHHRRSVRLRRSAERLRRVEVRRRAISATIARTPTAAADPMSARPMSRRRRTIASTEREHTALDSRDAEICKAQPAAADAMEEMAEDNCEEVASSIRGIVPRVTLRSRSRMAKRLEGCILHLDERVLELGSRLAAADRDIAPRVSKELPVDELVDECLDGAHGVDKLVQVLGDWRATHVRQSMDEMSKQVGKEPN
eukprot:scaffold255291_cov29-Tisochrysis_lutea.AAC.4